MLGIHRWGSYAELATMPAANLTRIPGDLSLADAAAMAATGPIALTQLQTGRVADGGWLLVTGATGALATMLATLAQALGARAIGLSRRPEAIPAALPLAARLNSSDPDLVEALLAATSGAGVATAVDNVVDDGLRLPDGLVHERPLDQAARAHDDMAAGRSVGHTVLSVTS
jgi:L-gulonate 5-dehydrogenase